MLIMHAIHPQCGQTAPSVPSGSAYGVYTCACDCVIPQRHGTCRSPESDGTDFARNVLHSTEQAAA